MPETRIGISGWTYPRWRGDFYPKGLVQRKELEYAAGKFNSIEVNGSFYGLLKPGAWRQYYERTPDGFLFAVKAGRFISHTKKLNDIRVPLANFFASGPLELKEKLGPILWQFPARGPKMERFTEFLQILPIDTDAAMQLARSHDNRVSDPVHPGKNRPIRYAFEIRDPAMFSSEFCALLRRHGAALVFSHSGSFPYAEEVTTGFVYLRLHGAPHTYADPYSDEDLDQWAEKIRCWTSGSEPANPHRITDQKPPARKARDAYIYFDNDGLGHAPHDALRLAERLAKPSEKRLCSDAEAVP